MAGPGLGQVPATSSRQSLLGELHDGGGGVVHEGSQDALELLVAERGALLAEHAHIGGALG